MVLPTSGALRRGPSELGREARDVHGQHLEVLADHEGAAARLEGRLAEAGDRLAVTQLASEPAEVGLGLGPAGKLLDREDERTLGVLVAARVEVVDPRGPGHVGGDPEDPGQVALGLGAADHLGDHRRGAPGGHWGPGRRRGDRSRPGDHEPRAGGGGGGQEQATHDGERNRGPGPVPARPGRPGAASRPPRERGSGLRRWGLLNGPAWWRPPLVRGWGWSARSAGAARTRRRGCPRSPPRSGPGRPRRGGWATARDPGSAG